ncbi:MAG: hypothetical protein GC180_11710 [Bacteroidetes bacterium]|nr:hypothetical protein [Bacteroidota bacterium]
MLKSRNILCMSTPSWEGDYAKTIVEMMRILAKDNKVLYVENPATWLDLFRSMLKGEWHKVRFLLNSKPKKIEEDGCVVHVLNPGPVIPINFLPHNKVYQRVLRWNNQVVLRKVRHVLKNLKMEQDLIHINAFNPMLSVDTLDHFTETLNVYYCYDEISASQYMKDHGAFLEPALLKNADLTVVTSEGLLENKKSQAKRIALVKNGVDFSLFSQGFREEHPKEVRIGYIGSIDDRMDTELLKYCMQSHPDWQWEFVGRINHAPTEAFLKSMPNVALRGARASCDLPVFLPNFSAGIIPFVKNQFTRGIYPLKINEYLAAGLPVVLTDFGLLDEFAEIAHICSDKQAFLKALEDEIHLDKPEKRKVRREFARNNSWKARAEVFSSEIEKLEHELKPES